ncbi:hypothetical protein [Marinobacter caseinilyticus]|uniref:hypothetical protein n=1 Tax=Marinobacter caseinilyticus TaxID=2692195 RepID=UPI00140900C6|nr:hypothetical protein [Marinobacter caseinilyticus]
MTLTRCNGFVPPPRLHPLPGPEPPAYHQAFVNKPMSDAADIGCRALDFNHALNVGPPTGSHHLTAPVNVDLISVEKTVNV